MEYESTEYRGHTIELSVDGTYDVMNGRYLVEDGFESVDEAKKYIDSVLDY